MTTQLFLTGASGFIGGAVLMALLKAKNYSISALVRNPDQAETLKQLGVTPVVGNLDDYDLLFEAAKAADAVINTASAENQLAVQAIVRGLKAKNNKRAVYIHTSGIGVLTFAGVIETPFDDLDTSRIHSIPLTHMHQREVDAWVFDNMDGLTAAIIAPATVHGVSTGPVRKINSFGQVSSLAKAAAARKKAGAIGDGNERWSNVHISDLADLYILVLAGLLDGTADNGREAGYYFGASHEHTWSKIAPILAQVLQKRGLVESTDTAPFEQEYIDKFLYGPHSALAFCSESRAVANRARKLGWNPTCVDIYQTVEDEVDQLIKMGEL